MPRMLEEALGTKFTIVTGYAGGNEIDLATERNESCAVRLRRQRTSPASRTIVGARRILSGC